MDAPSTHTSDKSGGRPPIAGRGPHTYEALHDWGEIPHQTRLGNCHGVQIDNNGLIYLHHTVHESSQSPHATLVFDPDGKLVTSWGAEFRGGAHGFHLNEEDGEEFFYLCDINRCIVVKTTLAGEEVMRIGYPEESPAYQPDADGARPKWKPTNLAVTPNGDIYVADGYGSSYIVQYGKDGRYIRTFGGKGVEAGQLDCPHGIVCDNRPGEPRILAADRANNRLQYFTLEGKHLWFVGGVKLPCHFDIRGEELLVPDLAARVTILDGDNDVAVHLGEGPEDFRERRLKSREHFPPGQFVCPHGACFDADGNIFVAEWVEIGRFTKLRKVN